MYKTEVVRKVARETRVSQRIVGEVLDEVLGTIRERLREGDTVVLPGFGTFYTSKRQGGTVQHIQTGNMVEYPARRVAAFRVGEILKASVRGRRRK